MGAADRLSDTVAMNLILLFGGIVGSYVFGAVWDRKNSLKPDVFQATVAQPGTTTNVTVEQ